MIKVFTSENSPNSAGQDLTSQIQKWKDSFATGIEILSVANSSNKYGWMVTVLYKVL